MVLKARAELGAIFFFQAMANGMWLVPLSRVLNSHGLGQISPYAYATTASAAFVSPLIFGAMADRHTPPAQVLRWLACASATGSVLASWSIARGWPAAMVLALIQIYSLVAVPTFSIASTIVFSQLKDSQRQFGPIRAVATIGWMCGCWLVSALNVDASPVAGYACAGVWLALGVATYGVGARPSPGAASDDAERASGVSNADSQAGIAAAEDGRTPPTAGRRLALRQRMGWDALVLLKHHDHRVVFLTAALFCIPLAAFYPFTPPQLQQLGFQRTSAWMSLGQVTEVIAMFCLAGLFAKWRLKWIFAAGLVVGLLRYVFCSVNLKIWVLAGVTLHGFSYTLFFITAQIYLNERVEPAWRARAQALIALMTGGVGNLLGYLGTGAWFGLCETSAGTRWPLFWGGLAAAVALVMIFFLIAYHGRGTGLKKAAQATT